MGLPAFRLGAVVVREVSRESYTHTTAYTEPDGIRYDQVNLDRYIPLWLDALAFEYQSDYGRVSGDLDIADLINNPAANGVCSVLRLGFTEEISDLRFLE